MAIYTRFGTPATIVSATRDDIGTWLTCRFEDGEEREYGLCEFKADDGLREIYEVINALDGGKTITEAN